jgi:hypothetical protein
MPSLAAICAIVTPTVSKNHCLSTPHVSFVDVDAEERHSYLRKHFDLQTVQSILNSQLLINICPFHSFIHQKPHYCMLLVLGANLQ